MDFAAMKRRELQALCKRHGLAAGGTNADLVARLTATLSGSGGAAEEAVEVVVGKGCLKRSAGGASGGDLDAAKKVTFELEEDQEAEVGVTVRGRRRSQVMSSPAVAKTRGRQKAGEAPSGAKGNGGERRRTRSQACGNSADESDSGEAVADVPARRSGRKAVNVGAGDVAERAAGTVTRKNPAHEEVNVGEAAGRKHQLKRKTRDNDIEDVDVSGQVVVSRRSSTRLSSLMLEPDALSSPVEKKRGRRKAADVKEKTCVEEQPTQAIHSGRTLRSGVVVVAPVPPMVSESKKSRREVQKEEPAVEKVAEVEISRRTTRSSTIAAPLASASVIANKRGRKTDDVHSEGGTDKKMENKGQSSRLTTRSSIHHIASTEEEASFEQVAAPSKGLPPRRSRRNPPEASVMLNTNPTSESSRAPTEGNGLKIARPTILNAAKDGVEDGVEKLDEHVGLKKSKPRKGSATVATSGGEIPVSDSSGKSFASDMQIEVAGPVRRLKRKSVVPSSLEHETNGMHEDADKKQTVTKPAGRSTRRSVAPVILEKESKGLTKEIVSEDVEKKQTVTNPVGRSTRRSVALAILEKESKGLAKEMVPEAHGERPTRKSVVPAMLEKGRKSIITEIIPEARVKRSTWKPALPIVNSENTDHCKVVSTENLQSDKTEELEKQPTVMQPVRRLTRKSAVPAMLEKDMKGVPDMLNNENGDCTEMQSDKVGHLEKQLIVKERVRRSTGKSVVPDVIEKENKGLHEELKSEVCMRTPVCKSVVPNAVNKENKDHNEFVRREQLSVTTRSAHTSLQVALQNDESPRRTTRQSSKGRPAKRRRTASLQESMLAEVQKEDHTDDVIEAATSTDLETGVLPFTVEKSDMRDSQLNSQQNNEQEGFSVSSCPKDLVASAQLDPSEDADSVVRNVITKDLICKEEEKMDFIPSSDINVPHEISPANEPVENASGVSGAVFGISQSTPISDEVNSNSSRLESPDALDNRIASSNTEAVHQDNKQECNLHNGVTHGIYVSGMSEAAQVEISKSGKILLPDVEISASPQLNPERKRNEFEAPSFSCGNDGTGKNNMSQLANEYVTDSCQDQELELPHDLSAVESPKVSATCQDEFAIGSGIGRTSGSVVKGNDIAMDAPGTAMQGDNLIPSATALLRNKEDTPAYKIDAPHLSSDHLFAMDSSVRAVQSFSGRLREAGLAVGNPDNKLHMNQVQQDDVQVLEGTLENTALGSATPESNQQRGLSEEAEPQSLKNERCSSTVEQSPFGLQSLFLQNDLQVQKGTLEKTVIVSATPLCKREYGLPDKAEPRSLKNEICSSRVEHSPFGLQSLFPSDDVHVEVQQRGLSEEAEPQSLKNERCSSTVEQSPFGLQSLFLQNDLQVQKGTLEKTVIVSATPLCKREYGLPDKAEPRSLKNEICSSRVEHSPFGLQSLFPSDDVHVEGTLEKAALGSVTAEGKHERGLPDEAEPHSLKEICSSSFEQSPFGLQSLFSQHDAQVQEGTLEKAALCSVTLEGKHECGLPDEAEPHSPKNERCSTRVEQSPFGLQPLFSQESIEEPSENIAVAVHAKNGVDESKDIHVEYGVEKPPVPESKSEDCAYTSDEGNEYEGLTKSSHKQEQMACQLDLLEAANCMKDFTNPEELSYDEENKKHVHSTDISSSCENIDANGPVKHDSGLGDGLLSSSLISSTDDTDVHPRSSSNQFESTDFMDEPKGCSSTEALQQGLKEQRDEPKENQVTYGPCPSDMIEADTVKDLESEVPPLPAEETSNMLEYSFLRESSKGFDMPGDLVLPSAENEDDSNTCHVELQVEKMVSSEPEPSKGSDMHADLVLPSAEDKDDSIACDVELQVGKMVSSEPDSSKGCEMHGDLVLPSAENKDDSITCHVEPQVQKMVSSEPDSHQVSHEDLTLAEGIRDCMLSSQLEHEKDEQLIAPLLPAETLALPDEQANPELEAGEVEKCNFSSEDTSQLEHEKDEQLIAPLLAAETSALPDEQANPELEAGEFEKCNFSSEDTSQLEHEKDEQLIAPLLAAETSALPDEQPKPELEAGEFEERNLTSEDTSGIFDIGYVKTNQFQLYEDYPIQGKKLPDDLPAPKSPEQSTIDQDAETLAWLDEQPNPELEAGEFEEHNFSSEATNGMFGTGYDEDNLFQLHEYSRTDPIQGKELPNYLRAPKSPEPSTIGQDDNALGSETSPLTDEKFDLELEGEEHNNSCDKSTGFIFPSGCVKNNTCHWDDKEEYNEHNDDQATTAMLSSDMTKPTLIEESECGMALLSAAGTPTLTDEQLNFKLEDDKEHNLCFDTDTSNFSDTGLMKNINLFSLPEDAHTETCYEHELPISTPAAKSTGASAVCPDGSVPGSVGICQTSGRRRIDEISTKLLSFKISSAVKGSYIAMDSAKMKQGDNLTRISLLGNMENVPAEDPDYPAELNTDWLDVKDSSRQGSTDGL